jgi:hypothetical protein
MDVLLLELNVFYFLNARNWGQKLNAIGKNLSEAFERIGIGSKAIWI